MNRGGPTWRRLFEDIRQDSGFGSLEAGKKITKSRSRNCIDALVALMLQRGCHEQSVAAAYALGWMERQPPIAAFRTCLADAHQHEDVRAQAAEGIGLQLMCNHRSSRERSKAETVLIRHLSDPSAAVRFWCCYALGTIRSKRAIPHLEQLRDHDTALVPGWWYVHEEASDMLAWIDGGDTSNERVPVHLRGSAGQTGGTR